MTDQAAGASPHDRGVGRPQPERDVVGYVARWGGNCRDCADESGVCPNSGLPCGGARKAIEHVIKALQYGVRHGYVVNPLAECGHDWTAESAANNWRSHCRLCGLQAAGSGQ